jgi:branched-chain amino acid transport system substrate-binding protein
MPFRVTVPLVVVAAFVALGLAAGRPVTLGRPDVIKIVSSLPRSGSARGQTDVITEGIKLAFADINYTLTVTDPETNEKRTFTIEYLDLDDATAAAGQWTIEQEITNANLARNDPDVMAYIGTYNSGAAAVSMPILNRAGVFMVSPANTGQSLTQPGTGGRNEPMCYRPSGQLNYARVIPTDNLQGELSVLWARDLGVKAMYILDDNELYGNGIAKVVEAMCPKYGIKVLGHQSIDSKAQEFTPLMTAIKAMKPDLVYFGGTTQTKAGQLLKDMVKVGLTCGMMGPDGCFEQAMINSAGADTFTKIPFYATFGGLPIDALTAGKGKEFVDKYAAAHEGHPPTDAYATYGYECALVTLDAIRRAGKKDRDAIRTAALATKDFEGATGVWSFDADGDTTNQTMSGSTVVGDQFKFARKLQLPPK